MESRLYCANCGVELHQYMRFCPKCGAEIIKNENKIYEKPKVSYFGLRLRILFIGAFGIGIISFIMGAVIWGIALTICGILLLPPFLKKYSTAGKIAISIVTIVIAALAATEIEIMHQEDVDSHAFRNEPEWEQSADENLTAEPIQESTQEPIPEPIPEPEAEDSDIHSLIVAYIDAAFIQTDMEKVKLYVDDVTNINIDEYKSRQKYIEAYQNIKCYKFEHDEAGTYVVFATYDEKIYNIETPAPSGKLFIIKKNPEDQKLYIHIMTEDEELDEYIASNVQQISALSEDVSKRRVAAMESDEELKAVLELMGYVGKK